MLSPCALCLEKVSGDVNILLMLYEVQDLEFNLTCFDGTENSVKNDS